jgi:hypothetical protein
VDVIPQCKLLARYRNYVVFFYFAHAVEGDPNGGLTYLEIEHVLETLETQVSNVLSTSTDTTPAK